MFARDWILKYGDVLWFLLVFKKADLHNLSLQTILTNLSSKQYYQIRGLNLESFELETICKLSVLIVHLKTHFWETSFSRTSIAALIVLYQSKLLVSITYMHNPLALQCAEREDFFELHFKIQTSEDRPSNISCRNGYIRCHEIVQGGCIHHLYGSRRIHGGFSPRLWY